MRKTALYADHRAQQAKMGDFAGWLMPLRYRSLGQEHESVRHRAGLFDVGHMGLLHLQHIPNDPLISRLSLSRTPKDLQHGQIIYTKLFNDQGGVIDDLLIYIFGEFMLWVVNAVNINSVSSFLAEQGITFHADTSLSILALQGPHAPEILSTVLGDGCPLDTLPRFHFTELSYQKAPLVVSRTGYTGEDGFELYTSAVVTLWRELLEAGAEPCGLIVRDVLRIEAGLPLYGQELLPSALPKGLTLKGLILDNMGPIPRMGMKVFTNQKEIGYITSGTFSPSLGAPIAMAYLDEEVPQAEVIIRGQGYAARLIDLPFYRRKIKKY